MTVKIAQTLKVKENRAGPGEFQIRLTSGEEISVRRESSTYKVELSEDECAQLEAEGYEVKPGLSAYRPKAKAKKPKKTGGVVKDIAAPNKEEE